MNNGFQLLISDDGSQILFDPTTGKKYSLLENYLSIGDANNKSHPQNYGNYHNLNMQMQHMQHNIHVEAPPQALQEVANQAQYPNLMSISPNRIHAPRLSNAPQNIQTRLTPQCEYQQENTSTPSQPRQQQATTIETETRGIDRDVIMGNNKRSLNESDEFITVISKSQRKKNQRTEGCQQTPDQPLQNDRSITTSITRNNQNKYNVPIDQLHRAVAHNLPCFSINFTDHENLPSAVVAAEELYDNLNRQGIKLNQEFSVVRYFGSQLKVGVKDKSDYQTLCNQKVWPKRIKNKQVSVNLPKFVPEQFSLVVRYIPAELSIDHVETEVKRSANTANNFRKIVYSYPRKTIDYRFTVADLKEYNGLLRLGHIGIGNKMRVVTPYRPANKITYCSKCWKLGHLRNRCQEQTQKCRVCLLDYDETHNQICSKQIKCAQCSRDHFSLDADCQMIQQYRSNLNKAVKQAVEDGAIRLTSSENTQVTAFPPPKQNNSNYPSLQPPLTTTSSLSIFNWKNNRTPSAEPHRQDLTNQELLDQFKVFMDQKMEQVDTQLKIMNKESYENKQAIEEVQNKLNNVVSITKSVLEDVLKPIIKSIPNISETTIQTIESLISMLKNQCENTETEDLAIRKVSEGEGAMTQEQLQIQVQSHTTI